MDLYSLIMMFAGIGIGLFIQRLFHVIEESELSTKSKTKKAMRKASSSSQKRADKKHHHHRHRGKMTKVTKSASPVISSSNGASSQTSLNTYSILSSPSDVSMSNISPKSSQTSMGTTQTSTPIVKVDAPGAAAASSNSAVAAAKAEKIVSPRRAVIRPSQVVCNCGVEMMDEKEKYSEAIIPPDASHPILFTNKTQIFPMLYEKYRPLPLIHSIEEATELSSFVTKKPNLKEKATLLTPFRPILHSMYYAHRHALLINDLIENYDHLED